jgi:enoyl-CoA hydratase/carnithine racemase
MPSETVQYEIVDKVGVITLNRPDARNALSAELLTELAATLDRAASDASVALVLTGAGDKAFCAGADLGKAFGSDAGFLAMHEGRGEIARLFQRLQAMGKPIIGAANGAALAGGLGLLLSCDLVVAASHATFGLPEVKRGLMPYMVMAIVQRQLGHKRALELILTGESISAARAEAIGLINQVLGGDFRAEVVAYAAQIAKFSPAILRLGKHAFYAQSDLPFASAIDYLHSQLTLNTLSEDAAEGIAAFFQKREPQWSGK